MSAVEAAQRAERPLGDLVHRAGGVDAKENALVGIEGDQRGRLLLVDLETVPDGVLAVVVALEQLTAAVVARIDVGRRGEQGVPYPPASAAGPPPGQSPPPPARTCGRSACRTVAAPPRRRPPRVPGPRPAWSPRTTAAS